MFVMRNWIALAALLAACGKAPPPPEKPAEPKAAVLPKVAPAPTPGAFTATVRTVTDGDTIALADGRSARYVGIDTPEFMKKKGSAWVEDPEPFGREATERNREILTAGDLRFIPHGKDHYDRLLVTVHADDVDVVETLLREGLGWLHSEDLDAPLRERYLAAQVEAIDAGRGIWSRVKDAKGEVNASKSGVFHDPRCYHKGKSYPSALDAFRAGLRPHKGGGGRDGCWKLP